MKRFFCLVLTVTLLISTVFAAPAPPEIPAPCAVLMERDTGKVLFEKNPHEKLQPASVTKVMTLLLVMEALDDGKITLDDTVTVSPFAASMGGSQVYLEPGETMSVDDMLKATVIASGNDSAVALAEHVAGSMEGFVSLMNERAKELGMEDTTFINCTGLPDPDHVTSAYDIALMSRALLAHDTIKNYSTVWMDTLRDGAFGLSNTNKLLRSYNGITGLKTGSTDAAKYCMSATAERDGMELIAAVMASPTSAERFSAASKLLDYGFANFALYDSTKNQSLSPVPVKLGAAQSVPAVFSGEPKVLVEKSRLSDVTHSITLVEEVHAPVEAGQTLGELSVTAGGEVLATVPILAQCSVERVGIKTVFWRMLKSYLIY
ncbi:MAG: D-alanyl-D-alanine carboxypeptidase [Oscillospiraceae bacterium]|nr:D-alanyl-D-alanine carboxypeptidase [Oscillospiraceae bacterium]